MTIPLRQYWDLLHTYLRPQLRRVLMLGVLLIAGTAVPLANPLILRGFIDRAVAGDPTQTLTLLALAFIGVALLNQGMQVLTVYLSEQVGWTATNWLRADLARHALGLDLPFHNQHTPGEMIERIDGDITALSNFFAQFVVRVLGSALLALGVLVLLWVENRSVGLVLTLFSIGALIVIARTRNIGVAASTDERQTSAELFSFLEERLAGLEDVRTSGAGGYVMRRFHQVARVQFAAMQGASKQSALAWMVTMALFTTGTVLTLALSAYLYQRGQITLGTVYLFFQYMQLLRRPLELIAEQLKEFQRASAGVGRVHELQAIRSAIPDAGRTLLPNGPLALELDNLHFGYGEAEPVVAELDVTLAPGACSACSGARAAARRRSRVCCCASTTWTRARCGSPGWMCATCRSPSCAAVSGSSRKTCSFSRRACART